MEFLLEKFASCRASQGKTTGAAGDRDELDFRNHAGPIKTVAMRALLRSYSMQEEVEEGSSLYQVFIKVQAIGKKCVSGDLGLRPTNFCAERVTVGCSRGT